MSQTRAVLFSVMAGLLMIVGAVLLFHAATAFKSTDRNASACTEQEKQIETLQSRVKAQDRELEYLRNPGEELAFTPASDKSEKDDMEILRLQRIVADLRGHIKELDNYIWGHRL